MNQGSGSVGPFPFCLFCGAHTRVALRKLGQACPRRVTSKAMQIALDRLRQGLHPALAFFLGPPKPFSFTSLPAVPGLLDPEDD